MLKAEDINKMLKQYIKRPEVQTALQQQGANIIPKSLLLEAANDLADSLYQASKSVVKIGGPLFPWPNGGGWTIRIVNKADRSVAKLKIDPDFLQRDSFATTESSSSYYVSNGMIRSTPTTKVTGRTGSGVYDIVGLFTQGYTPQSGKFAGGFWENAGVYSLSHSLGGRRSIEHKTFVDNVIDSFKSRYAHIVVDVTYPTLWHSN